MLRSVAQILGDCYGFVKKPVATAAAQRQLLIFLINFWCQGVMSVNGVGVMLIVWFSSDLKRRNTGIRSSVVNKLKNKRYGINEIKPIERPIPPKIFKPLASQDLSTCPGRNGVIQLVLK